MFTVKRSNLKLLSVAVGLLFTAGIYYSMHYRIPWEWNAPGIGKLPREIVSGYLTEAYDRGQASRAVRDYFSPDIVDNVPRAQDPGDGDPIPHQIRMIVGQGATVVVLHRLGPSPRQPLTDAIDIFETKNGRIVRRDRYLTSFAPS